MKIKTKPPNASQLIKQIEAHLPLPMYPTPETADVLRQNGKDVADDEVLQVTSVLDSGDMGGVLCSVKSKDNSGKFMISLTHLRVVGDHPLRASIIAYQKDRVRKLARQRW